MQIQPLQFGQVSVHNNGRTEGKAWDVRHPAYQHSLASFYEPHEAHAYATKTQGLLDRGALHFTPHEDVAPAQHPDDAHTPEVAALLGGFRHDRESRTGDYS